MGSSVQSKEGIGNPRRLELLTVLSMHHIKLSDRFENWQLIGQRHEFYTLFQDFACIRYVNPSLLFDDNNCEASSMSKKRNFAKMFRQIDILALSCALVVPRVTPFFLFKRNPLYCQNDDKVSLSVTARKHFSG